MKKSKDNLIGTGAIVGCILGLLVDTAHQSKMKGEDPDRNFDFQSLILAGTMGAIIGGASFGLIKFLLSIFNNRKEILDEADEISYLASVLSSYRTDEIDKQVLLKGKEIKKAINQKFNHDLLGKATYQGSVAEGTALSGLSDLDILVKFKKTSFSKESDMFNALHNFLKYNFNDPDLINIRKQKVSLGLIYNIQGQEEIIDVVPVLRTDFIRGKNDYNLFKNPKFSSGSKTLKMNPYKQKDFGNNENEKKSVLRLIKVLRIEEELPLKPILIKELIKKAFKDVKMPKTINQQLIRILEFIRDNIMSIKIKSPDNNRITLTDSISSSDKIEIKNALENIIYDLKQDKNLLQDYFPEK